MAKCERCAANGKDYDEDSFACKIRHLQMNTGDAKAGAVRPKGRQDVEITPSGRVIR